MPDLTLEDAFGKLIAFLGGQDDIRQAMEALSRQYEAIWAQDADAIGRVLRAHLAVEYFLTEYIQARNPGLGSLDEARASFTQKIDLLGESDLVAQFLKPGLKHLNRIRNRLAHRHRNVLEESDKNTFLEIDLFRALRKYFATRFGLMTAEDPLSILEDFARMASSVLQAAVHPNRDFWTKIFGELHGKAHGTEQE
jgi:hypothetical protein